MNLAVLGAGIVGLSTAVQLQEAFPTASVVLISSHFYDQTTSFGAAGIFRPTLSKTPGMPLDKLKTWLVDSWLHYDRLIHSAEAGTAGVQALSGYQFFDCTEPNVLESDVVYNYRKLTEKELNIFPNCNYKHGWFLTTILVEPGRYLPYLLRKFQQRNGTIIKKEIKSLEELVGVYDLVINCLGLGNRRLLNDRRLVPIRGQLIKVKAPWLKHFLYAGVEGCCYVVPGIDVVSIGGTKTSNDTEESARKEDTDNIMRGATKLMPSLESAQILYEWVGLRPFRNPLRLEAEELRFSNGSIKIVHNYGHGAEGISLSWGTSKNAVQLARRLLQPKASL